MASDPPAGRGAGIHPGGRTPKRTFRSRDWFADPAHLDMVALYLERFMNYGLTANELLSGKPIIGIAQTGGDLTPCNRVHLETVKCVRDGIHDAGGVTMEFPLQHPPLIMANKTRDHRYFNEVCSSRAYRMKSSIKRYVPKPIFEFIKQLFKGLWRLLMPGKCEEPMTPPRMLENRS